MIVAKNGRKEMNDRYLYRAKRCDTGEWIVGSLIQTSYLGSIRSWISSEQEDKARLREISSNQAVWRAFEVRTDTICQCTAVPDRDNTIMFENDVVRASRGVRGVIRFGRYGDEKTDYGFYIEWEKSQPYWRNDIYYWKNKLRVIGSYIDNPELLEVGE